MASIEKKGIRYFNIECEHEDKLEYILAKHGIAGYGIVIQLWRKIYQIEGYFCDWKEKNKYLFAKNIGVSVEELNLVIDTCFEEKIFNEEKFKEYHVLTSAGVQKRWLKIVKDCKRKDTDIDENLDLTGVTPEKKPKTPENPAETQSVDIQSKEEQTIEEEKKPKYDRDEFFEVGILKFFGFSEMPFHNQQAKILNECCRAVFLRYEFEYFKKQCLDYKQYIELIGQQYRKNFADFIGKQSECFNDGFWRSENWEQKIIDRLEMPSDGRGKDAIVQSFGQLER